MSSTAGDFRNLTPLVLRRALAEAGTRVHEPIQRFQLEMPADALGPLLPVLARLGAIPHTPTITGADLRARRPDPGRPGARADQPAAGTDPG